MAQSACGVLAGREQRVAHRAGAAHHERRAGRAPAPPRRAACSAAARGRRGRSAGTRPAGTAPRASRSRTAAQSKRVERAGERDRVDEEEQRAHGVEVQRRAVGRPPQQHDGADDEAEEAHEREVVEGAHVAALERLHLDLEHALLALAQQRVARALARPARAEQALEPRRAQRLLAVHRDEHVSLVNARAGRRAAGNDASGDQALRGLTPEGPVVHQPEARLQDEVRDAQPRQHQGGGHHEHVLDATRSHRVKPALPSTK